MTEQENSHRKGMVVVAHPDDAEWGCSGTVAKWCKDGMEMVYVICTDGSKGTDDPNISPQQLTKMRKEEQRNACKVLGVKEVVFLDYEDAMLEPTLELRKDIVRQIRKHQPDVLIAPQPVRYLEGSGYIGHPDHIAAGEATLSAVYPASRDRHTFPELIEEEGLEPHKVRELLIPSRHQAADKWIDVTDSLSTAIHALKQHESQVDPEDAEKSMRRWRGETGESNGVEYAEAFKSFQFG